MPYAGALIRQPCTTKKSFPADIRGKEKCWSQRHSVYQNLRRGTETASMWWTDQDTAGEDAHARLSKVLWESREQLSNLRGKEKKKRQRVRKSPQCSGNAPPNPLPLSYTLEPSSYSASTYRTTSSTPRDLQTVQPQNSKTAIPQYRNTADTNSAQFPCQCDRVAASDISAATRSAGLLTISRPRC